MRPVFSSDKSPPKPVRKRTSVACYNCRHSKVKCAPNLDDSRCQRCIERNLECRKGPVGTFPEVQGQAVTAGTSFYSDRGPQNAAPPIASQSPLYQYEPTTSVTCGSFSRWSNATFANSDAPGVSRGVILPDSCYSTAASSSLKGGVVGPVYIQPVCHHSNSSFDSDGRTVGHGSSHLTMPSMVDVQDPPFYDHKWDDSGQGRLDQPIATDGYHEISFGTDLRMSTTY